ncbi:MAG: hypothetical protein AAGM67_02195, partial [Bacteroidota bacterium]
MNNTPSSPKQSGKKKNDRKRGKNNEYSDGHRKYKGQAREFNNKRAEQDNKDDPTPSQPNEDKRKNKSDSENSPRIVFPRKQRRVKIRSNQNKQEELQRSKLVLDSGAMQPVVNDKWKIISRRPCQHEVEAFDGSTVNVDEIVSAAAKYELPHGDPIILVLHEAHLVHNSDDALVNPHAIRNANHVVSDTFLRHGGEQQIVLENGMELPLEEEAGHELCLPIIKPTDEDMKLLQMDLVLFAPNPVDSPSYLQINRLSIGGISDQAVSYWMKRLCLNKDTTKRTLASSTVFGLVQQDGRLRQHFKPRFPALSVRRLRTTVWTDTAFPAGGLRSIRGFTAFQIFYGKDSYISVYPMKSRQQYYEALQHFVTNEGAPQKLISDNASEMMTSGKVSSYLHKMHIQQASTEPYMPHQNRAERAIQHVKSLGLRVMRHAPADLWCYALQYCAAISNIQSRKGLNWRSPYEVRWGHTPDISHLQLGFYERIWYYAPERKFPNSRELPGRILGPAYNTGDALSFYILTETRSILVRSVVRPWNDSDQPLLPESYFSDAGEKLHSKEEHPVREDYVTRSSTHSDPSSKEEEPEEAKEIDTNDIQTERHVSFEDIDEPELDVVPFIQEPSVSPASVSNIDVIAATEDSPAEYRKILSHRKDDKGWFWFLVQWTDDSESWIHYKTLRQDDPVGLAHYCQETNLTNAHGLKWTRNIAMLRVRLVKQRQTRMKYGIPIPRTFYEARALDKQNGENLWQNATKKEVDCLIQYQAFRPLKRGELPPAHYQKAPLLVVFDLKSDLRRKTRIVVGGHRVDASSFEAYAPVASLKSFRIVSTIAHQKGFEVLPSDVETAYLETAYLKAHTPEMIAVKLGPEFGVDLQGR